MPSHTGDFALVIGINDYPSFGAESNNLNGAVDDAREIYSWLTNRKTGGGVPENQCKLIVSTPSPLAPAREQIDQTLEALWSAADEAPNRRRFYFYFSGHGHAENIFDVSLCLANWSHRRRHAALSSLEYRRLIHHCMRFDEVVVFLDCCRLRGYAATGLQSELDCVLPDDSAGSARSFVAYATEFQQAAFEDQSDGRVRGHLTRALLEGLSGGARLQPEGGVAAKDLADYLHIRVPEIADAHGRSQQVEVESSLPADPPTVFGAARLPRAGPGRDRPNCCISFSPERRGRIRLESPTLAVLRESDAATGPWRLTLGVGHYRLEEFSSGEERFFVQRVLAGVTDVQF